MTPPAPSLSRYGRVQCVCEEGGDPAGSSQIQPDPAQPILSPNIGGGSTLTCRLSLPWQMVDEYELYENRFKAEVRDRVTKGGALDLDDLPAGSALETCFLLVSTVPFWQNPPLLLVVPSSSSGCDLPPHGRSSSTASCLNSLVCISHLLSRGCPVSTVCVNESPLLPPHL